ncbi:MAG: MiaB/RimO family radical SAM methylthiotransferase [Bdellovibrionales bacterium]|nr:MiaB/RimO family radical SAM methylthiotransferase [Bdellovibrionales bacterium]
MSQLQPDQRRDAEPLNVAFETLGCRSNHADTIELQAALIEAGGTPVADIRRADVFVLNSCTVTDQADRSVQSALRRAKKENPELRVVVTGCMAETGAETLQQLGIADAIIGPSDRPSVLRAILGQSAQQTSDVPKRPARSRKVSWKSISLDHAFPSVMGGPGSALGELPLRARYHLRVQEGCENTCTFCIIPQSRGNLSSRVSQEILRDLDRLEELGYTEVVLTGTHLGGYGEDRSSSLTELLRLIASRRSPQRIRLSSIDPNDVDLEMLEVLATNGCFCPHLHICVQAFTDRVLKRMNRKYRLDDVFSLLEQIQRLWPACALGTDVIVGFPGETSDESEAGRELFERLPFAYNHVFPYSERQGTAATRLDGAVPVRERKARASRWRAAGQRKQRAFLRSLIGKSLDLVF